MAKFKDTPTIRALAGRLNISPSTVSLALNGRRPTGFVSASTRQQVWRAAEEMGYPIAKLRSRRPLLERVGIFARTHNTVYAASLLELCRVLNERGVEVVIHSVATERESVGAARDLAGRHEVDGAVFVGSRHSADEVLSADLLESLPSVYVGEVHEGAGVWQVRPDNEGGGRAVGQHLLSLGHKNIAALFPPSAQYVARPRLHGLRAVLEENGLSLPNENILVIDPFSQQNFDAIITRFMTRNRALPDTERVSALFCYNDWNAAKALRALRRIGVQVPDELSLVGFDNAEFTLLLDPEITTVEQPFALMGAMTADLLLEQTEKRLSGDTAAPRVITAPCTLVVRNSVTRTA
ncbi:MAG: LacI family DNA-binding transcriptional regulator [Cytophagales bacterium]|nr:LacI family DNA-binding transcriptional regulator [Armatimonadota bacterium]